MFKQIFISEKAHQTPMIKVIVLLFVEVARDQVPVETTKTQIVWDEMDRVRDPV